MLPVLGGAVAHMKHPIHYLYTLKTKHLDVFTSNIWFENSIDNKHKNSFVLCHPKYNPSSEIQLVIRKKK